MHIILFLFIFLKLFQYLFIKKGCRKVLPKIGKYSQQKAERTEIPRTFLANQKNSCRIIDFLVCNLFMNYWLSDYIALTQRIVLSKKSSEIKNSLKIWWTYAGNFWPINKNSELSVKVHAAFHGVKLVNWEGGIWWHTLITEMGGYWQASDSQ